MRVIFNHLLARVLHLGGRRLVLMLSLHEYIRKYMHEPEVRSRHEKEIETLAQDNIRLRQEIGDVLEAVEKSKPETLTDEQQSLINTVKRFFRKSSVAYEEAIALAHEADLSKELLKQLKNDELLASKE